jgi:phage gpG-like protein
MTAVFAPEFTYDRAAWRQARKRIHDMGERAGNVQAAWNVFLDWFAQGNRQQFGTQGKRWRTPWDELKPATVKQKRGLGFTGDILVRETTLQRSITDRPLSFERVGPHDMQAGTTVRYARFHHFGAPRANIPKRPLWSVAQIKREGAATTAIKTWIISGNARTRYRGGLS